jgi:hypothetical protein
VVRILQKAKGVASFGLGIGNWELNKRHRELIKHSICLYFLSVFFLTEWGLGFEIKIRGRKWAVGMSVRSGESESECEEWGMRVRSEDWGVRVRSEGEGLM